MKMVSRSVFVWGVSLLVVAVLSGCGTSNENGSEPRDWTVREGALHLQQHLHLSDSENVYFGTIGNVSVGPDDHIYIADGEAHHVKIFSPNGDFVDSLGTQGEGPGEFKRPSQVFFAQGDSIYVVDGFYSRLSVFAPDRSFAYRVSLRADRIHARWVRPLKGQPGYLASYASPVLPGEGEDQNDVAIRTVAANGTAGDTLFTVPPPQIHIEQIDRGVRMWRIPFGRDPHLAKEPTGHVHYAWGDSLTVTTYDRTGALQDTVDIPYEPVPVTDADRDRVLSDMSADGKAAVENKIPPTKPAFDHFLVDDQGRYWFGRPTSDSDSTAWWMVLPNEKRVLTETLPSEVEILTVQDGQAYGRTTTEMGAPALVRYRIQTSE